jgi:basic membrane protein A
MAENVFEDDTPGVGRAISQLAARGADAIFATSYHFDEAVREAAARHRDVSMFQPYGVDRPNGPPNIGRYHGYSEEARYILGHVAGLMVDPGAPIGFVASLPIAETYRAINAFALGVQRTNPESRIFVRWTGSEDDPLEERGAARSLTAFPTSARLIAFHARSDAVAREAQSLGLPTFGVHTDMREVAPRATIASSRWGWSDYFRQAIESACAVRRTGAAVAAVRPAVIDYWGSMRDRTVDVTPLNVDVLATHPRRAEIERLWGELLGAFQKGERGIATVFAPPVRDNTGAVRLRGRGDYGSLFREADQWLADNVIGPLRP